MAKMVDNLLVGIWNSISYSTESYTQPYYICT